MRRPCTFVLEGVERGQHQDRGREAGGAQLAAGLAAVEVGQQQIEDDQLGGRRAAVEDDRVRR
jgi:hypothetical protein